MKCMRCGKPVKWGGLYNLFCSAECESAFNDDFKALFDDLNEQNKRVDDRLLYENDSITEKLNRLIGDDEEITEKLEKLIQKLNTEDE